MKCVSFSSLYVIDLQFSILVFVVCCYVICINLSLHDV